MTEYGFRPFVSVHIEKTAGSSVGQLLVKKFGEEGILRYDAVSDRTIRLSDRAIQTDSYVHRLGERLARVGVMKPLVELGYTALRNIDRTQQYKPHELPADFAVLTGHFSADRFTDILPPEDFRYTSVLREPLTRMRSHYQHWQRTRGIPRFRVRPTYDSSVSFEDFALLPEMANYQTRALGTQVEQFYKIGVVDHLQSYLEEIGWQDETGAPPQANTGNYTASQTLDPGFLRDFSDVHRQDIELYESVKAQWHK